MMHRARTVERSLALLSALTVAVGTAVASAGEAQSWGRAAAGWVVALVLPVLLVALVLRRTRGERPAPRIEKWVLVLYLCVTMSPLISAWQWCARNPDLAYYVGVVRALLADFPAQNPELAGYALTQPGAYWGYYALVHALTGVPIPIVVRTLGVLIAALLLLAVHRLTARVWAARSTAFLAMALLCVPSHLSWWSHFVRTGRVFGFEEVWPSFPFTLAIAWYNGPALVLLVLALASACKLLEVRGEREATLELAFITALLPFFHPVYAAYALLAVLPVALFVVVRDRARWPLIVALSPLPFVLYQPMLGGTGLLARSIPWELLSLADATVELRQLVEYQGLLLAPALVGVAVVVRRRQTRAMPIVALAAVSILIDVLTRNHAENRHWDYNPMSLGLVPLAAHGLCAVRARAWRVAAVVAFTPALLQSVVAGPMAWSARALFRQDRPQCEAPTDYAAAAAFVREHSQRDAIVVTPPDSLAASWIEMYGERRLVFGHELHLRIAYPPHVWQPIRRDVERLLTSRTQADVAEFVERHGASILFVGCHERGDGCTPFPVEALLDCPFRTPHASVCRLSR